MSKWKCEICNSSFENFDARGFDNKIYCPLCYYKKLYKDTKLEIERLNNIINELNYGIKELDDMFYETFRISQNSYYSISEWELKEFTDKIKELKGSNDNG